MRIRIRRSFAIYILILAFFGGVNRCIGAIAALIVHEACHAMAAWLLKEPIDGVELAPFGGVMRYKLGAAASKGLRGIVMALAGPAGNYAVIVLSGVIPGAPAYSLFTEIVRMNLTMMLLNLLPALPFDGGMALFCVGYYWFDISRLLGALSLMGILIGTALCTLACIGVLAYAKLNLSLIIVGGYVLYYARFCKGELLAQNAYVVMCERQHRKQNPQKMQIYRACGNERLISLMPYMCKADAVAFLIETACGKTVIISDAAISREMMKAPHEQIHNLIEKKEKAFKS